GCSHEITALPTPTPPPSTATSSPSPSPESAVPAATYSEPTVAPFLDPAVALPFSQGDLRLIP
uniref:Uncharacterized protein n=1 Tax=Aegilops tauschii subsp. strangulata TaxID=200361 RepID=A0A453GWA8_AEGTS